MNEFIQTSRNVRRSLLTTASALVLSLNAVHAAQDDHPSFWIELGGQAERQEFSQSQIASPFMSAYSGSPIFDPASPSDMQRLPRYAVGGGVKIEITPQDSDWVFSASLRYGRANSTRNTHKENTIIVKDFRHVLNPSAYPGLTMPLATREVGDFHSTANQSHAVLDFMAGKDVGLGLFGHHSTSVLNAGIRYAQFSSRSTVGVWVRPDMYVTYQYVPLGTFGISLPLAHFHAFNATGSITHNFHGVGPAIAWDESVAIAGGSSGTSLNLDFGVNGALLFGRQKSKVAHRTTGYASNKSAFGGGAGHVSPYDDPAHRTQSRSVTVPNLGGFAGISYRLPSARLSAGYRIDYFFGAMDGGLDTRRTSDIGFHGPFATLSIGLGG